MCQHYHTSSIIIHSRKLMLKVLQNRFKPQAENVIAEEQACFRDGRSTQEHILRGGRSTQEHILRDGRSTLEHIFNLCVPCEKYQQH